MDAAARASASMVTDFARSRVVLFGGIDTDAAVWEWDGTQWHRRDLPGPSGRREPAMAYDSDRGAVLLFSGDQLRDTWLYQTPAPAAFAPIGHGCAGSSAVPELRPRGYSLPWLGDTFAVEVTAAGPQSALALLLTGAEQNPPIDLQPFGMPGCESRIVMLALQAGLFAGGTASWNVPVPNIPALVGAQFAQQALVLDPVNAAGLVTSNTGVLTLGVR